MASSIQLPNAVPLLSQQLLEDVGAHMHPANAEFVKKYPKNADKYQALDLENWVKNRVKDETAAQPKTEYSSDIDSRFQKAIQKWAQEKIEELNTHKGFHQEMLGYAQKPASQRYHKILSLSVAQLISSEETFSELPPAASWKEDDADMVIVEDPLAEQLAVLKQWQEQPSLVVGVIPQIRAALEYLKNNK